MKIARILFCVAACSLMSCSGLRNYQDYTGNNSATLSLEPKGMGGFIYGSDVRVDLYGKPNADCEHPYLGSVKSGSNKAAQAKIPSGTPLFGSLVYENSGFLSGDRTTSIDFYMLPKAGNRYLIRFQRESDAYDVAITEQSGKSNREIEPEAWPTCKSKNI